MNARQKVSAWAVHAVAHLDTPARTAPHAMLPRDMHTLSPPTHIHFRMVQLWAVRRIALPVVLASQMACARACQGLKVLIAPPTLCVMTRVRHMVCARVATATARPDGLVPAARIKYSARRTALAMALAHLGDVSVTTGTRAMTAPLLQPRWRQSSALRLLLFSARGYCFLVLSLVPR